MKNVSREELEKELWKFEYDVLCKVYAKLMSKREKKRLIDELLEKADYKDLEVEITWYKLS